MPLPLEQCTYVTLVQHAHDMHRCAEQSQSVLPCSGGGSAETTTTTTGAKQQKADNGDFRRRQRRRGRWGRGIFLQRDHEKPPPPLMRERADRVCTPPSSALCKQCMQGGGGEPCILLCTPEDLQCRFAPSDSFPTPNSHFGTDGGVHSTSVWSCSSCAAGTVDGGGGTRYRAVLWRGTCMYVCRPDSLYLRRQGLATYLVTYLRRDGEGNFLFIFLFYLLIYLFIYFFPFFILFGLLTTYIQRSKPQQQRNLTYSSSVPVPVRSCPFLFFRHPHTHIQSDTASPRTRKYVSTYVRRMAARKQGEREGEKSAGLALSRSMGHRVDRRM